MYGPMVSFLFAWFSCFIGKPGSIAIILLVFAEYMLKLFVPKQENDYNDMALKIISIGCIFVLTVLNAFSAKAGVGLQNVSTLLKVIALVVISLGGIGFYAVHGVPEHSQLLSDSNTTIRLGDSNVMMKPLDVASLAMAFYHGIKYA
jgi:amino acid transporter